jgi:ABC-type transport system substrate-binding protein
MSMAVSPALAHDWDGDGWDEEFGFWTEAVDWDVEWSDGVDLDEEDFDWDDVECEVEDIDYSGVFEEWEVELACG